MVVVVDAVDVVDVVGRVSGEVLTESSFPAH